jgi:ABC-type multidrug transport system fused ATPase/permease subunit
MKTIKNILNLLTFEEKKKYFIITILLFFSTSLEMVSLALIIPVFNIVFLNKIPNLEVFYYYNESYFSENSVKVSILILTLVCFVIKNFLLIFYNYKSINFFYQFNERITNNIIKIFLNQNYSFFLSKKSENILVKTFNNTQGLKIYLISLQILLTESLFLFGLISFLLYVNFKIFLYLFLVFFIVFFAYFKIFKKKIKTWSQAANQNLSDANNLLIEGVRGIKDIIIYNLNNYFLNRFEKYIAIMNNINSKLEFLSMVAKYWIEIVVVFIICSSLIFIIFLGNSISEYLPTFTLFAVAVFRLVPTTNRFLVNYQGIKYHKFSADEVCDTFLNHTFDKKKDNVEKNISFKKSLEFRNVCYSYNDNKESKIILNNINLKILKNEKVCIIGENGSGKSTLLNIISGILSPTSGEIYVDDIIRLEENNINWFKNISYVQQDVFLLNDTVKNNIILSNDYKFDDKRFNSVVDKLSLNNIFNNLSEGIDTKVGQSGSKLSGGQKQLISLARSVYKNSDILILDEPTSALDFNYISSFKNLILNLKDKTIIIVTHDQSLDNHYFDKVIKIKDEIAELVYVKK